MNRLFALSIGPVQDFIAAARRTRDLWFGSQVLSELSKAVAHSVVSHDGKLIFPSPHTPTDLDSGSDFSVANKLLFSMNTNDPAQLIQEIEDALYDTWSDIAQEVFDEYQPLLREEQWQSQVKDALEFYAAWVPLNSDYADARQRVERLLAGRKSLRDFTPNLGQHGLPKSSLDGSRESVLKDSTSHENVKLVKKLQRKTRLGNNEQLDAIGLIKRLGEFKEKRQYPSVSRMASDSWLRGLANNAQCREVLEDLKDFCSQQDSDFISSLRKLEQFSHFPYEADFLYEERLKGDEARKEFDSSAWQSLKDKVSGLSQSAKKAGLPSRPSPYFAILLADGDKMGAAISRLTSAEQHQEFSKKLSLFADQQAKAVIAKYYGFLVYSGGDDVLAFLPVDTCLDAARELHDAFGAAMPNMIEQPTLSVGIAIGHCMEPLEDLLNLARQAEKKAKQPDRNGMAIVLQTRGGGEPLVLRQSWQDNPENKLKTWTNLHLSEQISDKSAYDLRQLGSFYKEWKEAPEELVFSDAVRLLKRKRSKQGELPTDLIHDLLGNPQKKMNGESLMAAAQSLILARHLATAYQMAGKKEATHVFNR